MINITILIIYICYYCGLVLCIILDTCVDGCTDYDKCEKSDMGLFAEVRYFQLHDLEIPSSLSSRYTEALVLQEAEEREQYIQDAQLVRKDTERQVSNNTSTYRCIYEDRGNL